MGCKYVKEFDFGAAVKPKGAGFAKGGKVDPEVREAVHRHERNMHPKEPLTPMKCGGKVTKGYAKGGKVKEKATGETYPSKKAMVKHEMMETPRMQREEMMQKRVVKGPAMAAGRDPRAALIPPMKNGGLYDNIHAKRARIEAGSGEKMNKVGSKAAPSAKDFKDAAKTAMKPKKQYFFSVTQYNETKNGLAATAAINY